MIDEDELDRLGVIPRPAHAPVKWPKKKPTLEPKPLAKPEEL